MPNTNITKVIFTATPIVGKDLQPGQLFSAYGPEYWDYAGSLGSIGEMVYVRTNTPAEYAEDANRIVYHIRVRQYYADGTYREFG